MRPINHNTAEQLKQQGMPAYEGELGDVLVDEDCLIYDDNTLSFDLVKFLGMGTVTLAVA